MKSDILFMLRLISCVVLEKEVPEASEDINWENILRISMLHNMANIVAYGIAKGNYEIPLQIKSQFNLKLYERMTVSDNQNAELRKILTAFEEENIEYMPLKGVLLQSLYPSHDMRSMADMDILIKPEEKEKINNIMTSLGYEFKCESNHEYVYSKKPYVSVELHKLLIPSYNEDMYKHYGDGWKRAKKCEGRANRYELSLEDNFIYIFTHFAKHYRDGGIGIKAVLDIFLYLEKYRELDREYIEKQFSNLNLSDFYNNITRVIECWFYGAEFDELSKSVTEFIINSGTFGRIENQTSAEAIRDYMDKDIKKAEKQRYTKLIFPNIRRMQTGYPILKKVPVLLPFMWVIRIIKLIIFKRKNIDGYKRRAESVSLSNIDKFNRHIKKVGLDIYNGRKSL